TFVYLQAIVNYRKAIRINDPFLKRAAKRAFSPIWSARHHPIYQLIEVADEIQLMQLSSEIRNIVKRNCIISWSRLYEQYQGLDTIIEKINKVLKALIPPISQDHHWKIAMRKEYELDDNLKNFIYFAKMAQQKFITETFINKTNLFQFRPILITKKEADAQKNEENMKKDDILIKIETLLEQLGESAQKKYSKLRSKSPFI
ncbi:5645_t:CDS:2, partial [Scutellospora calospora]